MRIRPELDAEAVAVRGVVQRAFGHHPVVADLVDALRASPAWLPGLSFVADDEGKLVGHVLLTRALLDAPRRLVDVLVLSPLGVIPERQRQGFAPAEDAGFRRPSLRIPVPAFMVHELPAYQRWMTGTLVYPDPFWRLDCVGLRD